jgi:AcrR family transcriptional regulator
MRYMPTQEQGRETRARLLDAAVDYALAHAIAEVSLRQLAVALGTSHRMLIHHFGSREELLIEVIKVAEERQRARLAETTVRQFWRQLRDPAFGPQQRLFFEVYGQALRGQPWATPMLDGVVDDWVDSFAARLVDAGVAAGAARTQARLGLAVTRGLLLDLLATGDVDAVDEAMDLFVSLSSPPRPSTRRGGASPSRSSRP